MRGIERPFHSVAFSHTSELRLEVGGKCHKEASSSRVMMVTFKNIDLPLVEISKSSPYGLKPRLCPVCSDVKRRETT